MTADEQRLKRESPAYRFTLVDKIAGAAELLRMRSRPAGVLLAGPYVGEFGYELMLWHGFVRALIPAYREVHVITYPGRDILYPGCRVHAHGIDLAAAGYGYGRMTARDMLEIATEKAGELGLRDYDVFTTRNICTRYHRMFLLRQKLVMLRAKPIPGGVRDVALHLRCVDKDGPDKLKNYPGDSADVLAKTLLSTGMRVCCIGHPKYAYCPPGCEDLRAELLESSVAAVCASRLVVGENSGPMHLANLCGMPTLIWAADPWRVNYSLRWNVFHVPIFVAANDTHQPSPGFLAERILEALDKLRGMKCRLPDNDEEVVADRPPCV